MLDWWTEASPAARRAFIAAALGWTLDSFDVNLFALVLPSLMQGLQIDQSTAGSIQSLTLLSAAGGGLVLGVVADHVGRTRALIVSVLLYSIFTALSGLATSAAALAVFRIGLGLGMGGEWASGAALVSETWPDRHRAKALAFMQSAWAIGFALAAVVSYLVQSVAGLPWRAVFFVGIGPALVTLWIRRRVEEPALWRRLSAETRVRGGGVSVRGRLALLAGPRLRLTAALALMNSCTLFAYWGFNTWIPTYLSAPPAAGGVGLAASTMTGLLVANQIGTWLGYVTFGFVADVVGRKRTYVAYLLLAAGLIWLYPSLRSAAGLLILGPVASFFATGHFSGFGTVTGELYPTEVRATAQGFTYNLGRIVSAAAPRVIGSAAQTSGYAAALSLTAAAFLLASMFWLFIPETKGRPMV